MTNQHCPHGSSTLEERVLVWAHVRDARLTCRFVEDTGLSCLTCATWEELAVEWPRGASVVVAASELLTPAVLDSLEAYLAAQPAWSDPPIIIVGGAAEPAPLDAFMRSHNVALLQRPVAPKTLRSSVAAAVRARRRQYQIRDLLQQKDDAEQRKDEFLAMLAHELRNPLAPLRTGIELVRLGARPDAVARTHAMMERQVAHLTRLVDDLLDVSRITRRRILLKKRPLDLRESVRQSVDAMRPIARDKGVQLDVTVPPAPVVVSADVVRIEQMIGNLVGNAIKFTPAGGAITVAARLDAENAVITVRDTGIGIAADQLDKVFELFAQAPRSLDRSQGGLGVGLTVVKLVAELHDGSAGIRSADGHGTEVVVRLPLLSAGAVAVPAAARLTMAAARKRVLVVEDNRDAAEMLAALLAHHGHDVVVAHDGHAGLEAALRHRPQVLLCDIGLPGLDGYEIARRLHGEDGFAACLMIAITGYGEVADRERAHRAGFAHHITKPADPDYLMSLVGGDPRAGR